MLHHLRRGSSASLGRHRDQETPTVTGSSSAPLGAGPAAALERELYWAAPPVPDLPPGVRTDAPGSALALRWNELEERLRYDYTQVYPPNEEVMEVGSGAERRLKRLIARFVRPLTRRHDRFDADIARLGYETAQAVAAGQRDVDALLEQWEQLTAEIRDLQADVTTLRQTLAREGIADPTRPGGGA
jgi:hypothetical protein